MLGYFDSGLQSLPTVFCSFYVGFYANICNRCALAVGTVCSDQL
jgi:hypothetical protein